MKKNILMLGYEFPPLGGGAGTATYFLLKEFEKFFDISITLITSSTGAERREQFTKNCTIHFLDIGKRTDVQRQSLLDVFTYYRRAKRKARELLAKEHFDMAHAFQGVPAGYIARGLSLPYVVSLRGSDVPGHNPAFRLLYLFLSPCIRAVWRGASRIVANSRGLREEALRFESSYSIEVIPNGIEFGNFRSARAGERAPFTVLYVGRLHPVKGVEYLLEGFTQFALGKHDVKLVLVGSGPLYGKLHKASAVYDTIDVVGYRKPQELPAIYESANVFVLPSLGEGMSNTTLEAMASALPIISTDVPGTEELVSPDNGIVVEKKNSRQIAEALERLYHDTKSRASMGAASRKKAEGMSWEKAAKSYYELYKEICAG